MDKELQSLVSSIEESDYEDYPYEYLYAINLFSDEFYNDILNHLPPDERFFHLMHADAVIDREKKTSSRLHLDVKRLSSDPVWKRMDNILQSKELKKSLLSKFKTARASECSMTSFLSRDKKQYKISPHPDDPKKIITLIIYLPEDDSHEELGTNILSIKRGISPNRLGGSEHHRQPKDFKLHRKTKFHKNSCIAFPVTKHSFHSVDPTPYKDEYVRNSLQCFYFGR